MHSTEERLLTGYSGRLLLVVSLGWTAIQAGRLVLSPLLPAIRADLGLSATQAGLAFSTLWGLYALCQYPSGRLSDELTRKTLLVAGLLLLAVGFLLLGGAPAYPAFLFGAAVVGVGAGLYPTAARALVSDLFVERRGQAFGLHTASGDIGGVTAAALASVVLAVATWRAAFLPSLAVVLLVALAVHRWSRERYVVERTDLAVGTTVRRLLGDRQLRWLLVGYALYAFTWQATAGFLPTFLQEGKAFSPAVANLAFAVLFGVGVLAKPLAGGLGDRLPRELLSPAVLLLGALALAGIVLARTPATALAAVVLFAVGLMAFPPVMQSFLMDVFPAESAGGDLGAMRSVYVGIGAAGPTYVGAVADALDFRVAFVGLVGCLFVAAAVIFVAGR